MFKISLGFVVVVLLLAWASPVSAQTPTPPPTPTPSVIAGDSGTFVVEPVISYGEAALIVVAFLIASLMLLQIILEVLACLRR